MGGYIEANAEPVLKVCHELVKQALEGSPRSFVFQIALRAITWYADAVSDASEETRILKCVTAIECLTLPPDKGTKAAFVIRGSLLAQRNNLSFAECAAFAMRLNGIRNDVAHGNVESLDRREVGTGPKALDFTRRVVLEFLRRCGQLRPLGSRREGTREDILELYRLFQTQHSTVIDSATSLHQLQDAWKKVMRQK
jgi:hypothetical protein